jgi:hypothetical protein
LLFAILFLAARTTCSWAFLAAALFLRLLVLITIIVVAFWDVVVLVSALLDDSQEVLKSERDQVVSDGCAQVEVVF